MIKRLRLKERQLKICPHDPSCSTVRELIDEAERLEQALADAKREGVHEFLNKAKSFVCTTGDCGECPENNGLLCGLNSIVRVYGVDEVIKKVEAERG